MGPLQCKPTTTPIKRLSRSYQSAPADPWHVLACMPQALASTTQGEPAHSRTLLLGRSSRAPLGASGRLLRLACCGLLLCWLRVACMQRPEARAALRVLAPGPRQVRAAQPAGKGTILSPPTACMQPSTCLSAATCSSSIPLLPTLPWGRPFHGGPHSCHSISACKLASMHAGVYAYSTIYATAAEIQQQRTSWQTPRRGAARP